MWKDPGVISWRKDIWFFRLPLQKMDQLNCSTVLLFAKLYCHNLLLAVNKKLNDNIVSGVLFSLKHFYIGQVWQSGSKWINCPAVTPAIFSRRSYKLRLCLASKAPSCQDELGNVWRNALRLQGLLETCHAANNNVSFSWSPAVTLRKLIVQSVGKQIYRTRAPNLHQRTNDLLVEAPLATPGCDGAPSPPPCWGGLHNVLRLTWCSCFEPILSEQALN